MSEAFLVRRGGITNAFAMIAVTYPAGSTCTCTCASKVLKAKDTSGSFLFMIPSAGTWVVKSTKGSESTSQNVSITKQYQSVNVTLAYEFVVVRSGVSNVTWTTNGKSLEVLNSGSGNYSLKMTVYAANSARNDFFTSTPKIDFTSYKTLYIKASFLDQTGSEYRGIIFGPTQYSLTNAIVIDPEGPTGTRTVDKTIDISNVSGNQYISFYRAMWLGTEWTQLDINSLYLR